MKTKFKRVLTFKRVSYVFFMLAGIFSVLEGLWLNLLGLDTSGRIIAVLLGVILFCMGFFLRLFVED